MLSRSRTRLGIALCTLGAIVGVSLTPIASVAVACFGYTPPPPPMPECFKSYTFSFSIPDTILANPGGMITIPLELNHFVTAREAVPQMPVCPPGPYTIRASADIMCDDGTVITDIPLMDVMHPGFGNLLVVDGIEVPGEAGCCMITITSTVLFEPGCTLTQTQKQSYCVVEESDDIAGSPRLKLRRTSLDALAHPGDQSLMCYTLTNCDLDQCVEVTLDADMRNVAGAPTGGDATNTIIVSDPNGINGDVGDNFPIEFEDLLLPPFCIPLPLDPGATPIPVITRTIKLQPGESVDIKIVGRSWPMCADGSCGHSLVRAFGVFENEISPVKACASAIMVVDNAAPPRFEWPDAGTVGCMGPDPIGGLTGVGGFGFPSPRNRTSPWTSACSRSRRPRSSWMVSPSPPRGSSETSSAVPPTSASSTSVSISRSTSPATASPLIRSSISRIRSSSRAASRG